MPVKNKHFWALKHFVTMEIRLYKILIRSNFPSFFSPGFPEATLEWTVLGSSTILHVGPVLTLESLKLSDTNDYICTPTNQVGDGESATQRLDVLGKYIGTSIT